MTISSAKLEGKQSNKLSKSSINSTRSNSWKARKIRNLLTCSKNYLSRIQRIDCDFLLLSFIHLSKAFRPYLMYFFSKVDFTSYCVFLSSFLELQRAIFQEIYERSAPPNKLRGERSTKKSNFDFGRR